MRAHASILLATAVVALAACGGGEDAEVQQAPSAADTVQAAMAQFDAAAFDTVTWEKPADAVVRGSVVFNYSCKKCHGPQGYGDGGFVMQGDTLRPPSFHDPDWKFKNDLAGLRRQISIGTTEGMPHWGLEGLKAKDVDAVAHFILETFAR